MCGQAKKYFCCHISSSVSFSMMQSRCMTYDIYLLRTFHFSFHLLICGPPSYSFDFTFSIHTSYERVL